MFILASSVCTSLQCLISTLTQGGKCGHLFRLTCSVVLWGGRNTANKYHGMCGECSQCMDHTGFVSAHGTCALLVYTTQAPDCSAGELSKVGSRFCARPRSKLLWFRFSGTHKGSDSDGHAFWALPRSEQLRRPGAWRAHCPRWAVHLNHLPCPRCSVSWVQQEHHLRCAVCLLWGAGFWLQPSWQMSTI